MKGISRCILQEHYIDFTKSLNNKLESERNTLVDALLMLTSLDLGRKNEKTLAGLLTKTFINFS